MTTHTGASLPLAGMGAMTFDDEVVTSPLCGEPVLALGTIVEAREGSTSGESETEPPPPSICSSLLRRDQTVELSVGEEAAAAPAQQQQQQHPDVDGGWAWVVLMAMFLVFVFNSGLLCTTGMYFVQMLGEYGKSRSYTAWMGSLINAFFMLGGPISAAFIERWGCRASLMFGAVVMMVGYLASAFATSLEMLFVTYGVIVACGMNFAYSGQIIALAQYFDKKQSIATSIAMIGIGLGIFFLSSLTEYFISEYGWRGSFVWSAGLSLQIAVLGALVFPLKSISQNRIGTTSLQQQNEDYPGSTITFKGIPASKSRVLFEKSLNDRSFSSLRLSVGASYLSHSILSLHDSQTNNRHDSHYDLSLRSNQHSFCSRGSHFAIGSIRSNGYSFCTRDSHAELSHFELHSNQFSFHNRDTHGDSGLQSNTHSFCSRRDSQAGVSDIKSNPHSFSKTSQIELHQHLHNHQHLEREAESLKAIGAGYGGQARFLLREGDCDLSCCAEEDEEPCSSDKYMHTVHKERRSLCMLLIEKMKLRSLAFIRRLTRKSTDHPLLDPRFWLMDFSIFFAMLGTLCLQIIYKDFAESKGVGDYYSMALSGMGIGDLCGRILTGFLVSKEYIHPLLIYSLAMLLCCLVIAGHVFITTSTQLLTLIASFGYLYGSQNTLIAVTPSLVFGRDKLPTVFGHILFLGGIGALIGAPIAGSIADTMSSYDGVIWFSVASLSSGTFLMFMCYCLHYKKIHQQEVNV